MAPNPCVEARRERDDRYADLVLGKRIIPAVLISGINSDLPGPILAQVSQNVLDSASGKYVLIPQGSRLIGAYSSANSYGQQRVSIAFGRERDADLVQGSEVQARPAKIATSLFTNFEGAQAYDPVNFDALRKLVPPAHILFGTDYNRFPIGHSVALFERLPIAPALRRAIERENALALFPRFRQAR